MRDTGFFFRNGKKNVLLALVILMFIGCVFFTGCIPKQTHSRPPVPQGEQKPAYLEHVVRYSGETLALIAGWYTGKPQNWTIVRDANPGIRPNAIRLGDVIRIPQQLVVEERPLPKERVRVQRVAKPDAESGSSEAMGSSEAVAEGSATMGSDRATGGTEAVESTASGDSVEATGPSEPTAVPTTLPTTVKSDAPPAAAATVDDAERERLLNELLNQ